MLDAAHSHAYVGRLSGTCCTEQAADAVATQIKLNRAGPNLSTVSAITVHAAFLPFPTAKQAT